MYCPKCGQKTIYDEYSKKKGYYCDNCEDYVNNIFKKIQKEKIEIKKINIHGFSFEKEHRAGYFCISYSDYNTSINHSLSKNEVCNLYEFVKEFLIKT